MGTASYVLAGSDVGGAFHSTCHGAGRTMSRHAARGVSEAPRCPRSSKQRESGSGHARRAPSPREAPFSYKDIDDVVATCERTGLARRVARLRPIGVVKA